MRRHCLAPVRFETTENPFDPSLPNRQKKTTPCKKKRFKAENTPTVVDATPTTDGKSREVSRCCFCCYRCFLAISRGLGFPRSCARPGEKGVVLFFGFSSLVFFLPISSRGFFFLAGGEDWVRVERRRRRDETTAASRPEEGISKKKKP